MPPSPPAQVEEITEAVKRLGHSEPLMQVGDAVARTGTAIQDGAKRAMAYARGKAEDIGLIERTPQGTTKGSAPKKPATDVALPTRKRLKQIKVEPTTNGGFVVSHHYHPERGGTPAPDRHAFTDAQSAYTHLETTTKGHQ